MKKFIKNWINNLGYKVSRINLLPILSDDPLDAIKNFIVSDEIIVFDVGANLGQTINKINKSFSEVKIFAFEPSKKSFKILQEKNKINPNITLNNLALGSEIGEFNFNEYNWSAMDSLLVRTYGNAHITNQYLVEVSTVDNYCQENNITYINLLKTDTEGYELNVLKGASKMLSENKIQFILVEIFFNENYKNQASLGDIYNYLLHHNLELVRFYEISYTTEGMASKTDALFVNRNFLK